MVNGLINNINNNYCATQNMPSPVDFPLLDRDVIENPYPFYQTLVEQAPVYQVPGTEVYLVSSWQLIREVLKNQADYSANLTGIIVTGDNGQPELFDLSQFGGSVDAIANADEPHHAVHRKLVLPQLNARKVAIMEQQVHQWAQQRVQDLVDNKQGDCIGTLANAIPVMVTARLLGLPVEDLDQLLSWAFSGGDILAGTTTLEHMAKLSTATSEMVAYLDKHFTIALQWRASEPAEDIMGELARGVRQKLISHQDAVSILVVLVGAAGESTSSLIGSAIRILAQDQTLQQRLRHQPTLISNYIEEVVRLESPFKGHYRVVLNETQLGDVLLPKNARVYLLWAAANRDPSVFEQPDQLNIDRGIPTEHLGFGHGIHFCVGARLARLETRIILQELLQRTTTFIIDPQYPIQHMPSIFVRRLAQLHLQLS
jgi:cytochrome P450 family 144